MRRLMAGTAIGLIVGLAWYGVLLRTTLAETHIALEEATSSVAQLSSELAVARQDADRLIDTLSVLGAENVVMVGLRGQGAVPLARGRAFVSPGRGLVMRVSGLDVAMSGRLFHLWAVTGRGPVSLGTFEANPFGAASLTRLLPAGIGRVRALSVTAPVAGDAWRPGAEALLTGALPAD